MLFNVVKLPIRAITRLVAFLVLAGLLSISTLMPGYAHAKTLGMEQRTIAGDTCLYINEKYAQLSGLLGLPISPENVAPDGVGHYRHYQRGSIYWSPQTCAHEVHGAIRYKWALFGWERSFLGYPVTDELGTLDGIGRFNDFQGGSIFWTPQTGAHEVHGAIRYKWALLGYERGPLGYPLTDESTAFYPNIRFNLFQRGSIYSIVDPSVTQYRTAYKQITFSAGDRITIDAGGCVQTGGWGSTWKRYVDPQGPDSDRLYHGLIYIPGATQGLVRIQDVIGRPLGIPANSAIGDNRLQLGYEDDNYGGNGYSDHDDGTGGQCRGVGDAFVMLTIEHNATP